MGQFEFWDPTLEQRFCAWVASEYGAEVEAEITKRARALRQAGWSKYSMAAIFEAARFARDARLGPAPDSEPFKLNNSWRSFLARRIEALNPELAGFFTRRRARETGE